ncbi:uncharacterized protein LOC128735295 [Sabethes cyaneus]|uniref:uncharacterized protein LOC128735295 n=1 Tax=Sabethes cyaneus TaxID=53552 RepID=UPI00237E23AC|nr:uncharacterized protein LOC128735295 [Sabethes cyaneus]
MVGDERKAFRKSSVISSVQLGLVLFLYSSFFWHGLVGCLPRLAVAVEGTAEAESLIAKQKIDSVISARNDDIIKTKRMLAAFVDMPASSASSSGGGRKRKKFKRYRVGGAYQPSATGSASDNVLVEDGINEVHRINMANSVESEELDCILGNANNYLGHWLNSNGTINTESSRVRENSLDLSNNVDLDLIRDRFRPFLNENIRQKLIYLSMARNGLSQLPASEFSLINSTLTHFSAMGNVLNPFSLPRMENLRVLDLRYCGLSFLPAQAFVNTSNLWLLFLSHNSLTELNANQLIGLSGLRHLDISYNVQAKYAGFTDYGTPDPYNSLTEGLNMSENTFTWLTNLSFLDVSHTKLLSISSKAFRHVAVQQLSLCYTGIAIIVGSMMNGSLKVLDISGNPGISTAIHHEQSDSRGFNVNLEILVCQNSTVKHLDWLNGMISLRVLLLGTNNINQLKNGTFANLPALEILDLSNNHISNWHQQVFKYNPELYILDLSENNINVLTTEMLYDFASVNFLAVGQNSFVCHCLLREFVELAAKTSQAISCLLHNLLGHAQDTSDNYEEMAEFLQDYGYSGFSNSLIGGEGSASSIHKSRKVFEPDPHSITNFSENGSVSLSHEELIPSEDDLALEQAAKATEEYNVLYRVVQSYVSTIYDSNTKFLESLAKYRPVSSTSRFIAIDCSNRTATNGGQPEYANSSDPFNGAQFQIIDFDEERYKCIDLDDSEFYLFEQERCTFDRSALLPNLPLQNSTSANIVKFILIFFGFALVAFIIYISKWEHIKYFCIIVRNATILSMMAHKAESKRRRESESSPNGCFAYDVFVSYSEQDRQWVLEELLPNLEQTEDINVCLHERDFKVGISILENIIYCIDNSRALLLIMSESFLLSQWCQFEMHLAQHRLLETRREQLILVLLEDIPRVKRSKTLHYLMKTKTYIIWPKETETEEKQQSKNLSLKNSKKSKASRKEKNAQNLADERKLFWKRLREAIDTSADWAPQASSNEDVVVTASEEKKTAPGATVVVDDCQSSAA